MKYSDAMLKGFEKVGGRQYRGFYFGYDGAGGVDACCAVGAVTLGGGGGPDSRMDFMTEFERAWNLRPEVLNDAGMPWEHIYGMAVAAGL